MQEFSIELFINEFACATALDGMPGRSFSFMQFLSPSYEFWCWSSFWRPQCSAWYPTVMLLSVVTATASRQFLWPLCFLIDMPIYSYTYSYMVFGHTSKSGHAQGSFTWQRLLGLAACRTLAAQICNQDSCRCQASHRMEHCALHQLYRAHTKLSIQFWICPWLQQVKRSCTWGHVRELARALCLVLQWAYQWVYTSSLSLGPLLRSMLSRISETLCVGGVANGWSLSDRFAIWTVRRSTTAILTSCLLSAAVVGHLLNCIHTISLALVPLKRSEM